MFLYRTFWFVLAVAVYFTGAQAAPAAQSAGLIATNSSPLVVKIEARKGIRLYGPDVPDEGAMRGESLPSEQTAKEKIDQCMASWDTKTHITKSSWREICEREIKNNE